MSPILVAVCLAAQTGAADEKGIDFENLHSAIRFVTPDDRHRGKEIEILRNREEVYREAKRKHPERWSGEIRNWSPILEVVINPTNKPEMIAA